MSASSLGPIRSTGTVHQPTDTHACTSACSLPSSANTSKPISTWRSRASSRKRTACLLSAARAHLGWAEALAARGEAARAREHAARALELSREHGYGLFEERAAALVEKQSTAETDPR